MANTDIFNPNTGWSDALGFNPNWNYGSPRKTAANYASVQPSFGRRLTRVVGNGGYSFDLTFVDRPIEQVLYIKRFYEQFQQGFFTLIDYDNGSRHHTGNFTSYSDDTETANVKYTIRVTFVEIPGAAPLVGPSDWAGSSHPIYVANDFGKPLVATSGASWLLAPDGYGAQEFIDSPATAGDFAQVEYVGWGFQLGFRLSPDLGICNIFVDGTLILNGFDLSTGTYTDFYSIYARIGGVFEGIAGVEFSLVSASGITTLETTGLPLDRHRVKVVATATKNPAATATDVIFPTIQVMH